MGHGICRYSVENENYPTTVVKPGPTTAPAGNLPRLKALIKEPLMEFKKNRYLKIATALSLALYLYSLVMPAFIFEYIPTMKGFEVLILGCFGILMLDPRWFANIAYAFCMIAIWRQRKCAIVSIIGLLLTSGSFILPIYHFPTEAAGVPVKRLGVGAFTWGLSLIIVFVSNLVVKETRAKGP